MGTTYLKNRKRKASKTPPRKLLRSGCVFMAGSRKRLPLEGKVPQFANWGG